MRVFILWLLIYFISISLIAMDKESLKKMPLPTKILNQNFAVQSLCYSKDGQYLVVGSDKTDHAIIRVWKTKNTDLPLMDLANSSRVDSLDCNYDNTNIAATSDQSCKFWDMETGTCVKELKDEDGGFPVSTVRYNNDGSLLLCVQDKKCKIWDVKSGKYVYVYCGHEGIVRDAQWNQKDDDLLASCAADNTTKLWDRRKAEAYIYQLKRPHQMKVAFCPSGEKLITASSHLFVYAARTGVCEHTYNLNGTLQSSRGSQICDSSDKIRSLATRPETDEYIIALSDRGSLCICNQDDPEQSIVFAANTEKDTSGMVVVSPDGQTLAVGSYDEQLVRFWRFQDCISNKKKAEAAKADNCCIIH